MVPTIASIRRELAWAHKSLSVGFARFAIDIFAFRALRLFPHLPSRDSEGHLTTRDGVQIIYRRNRGDIQSIREVFIDGGYRLPITGYPKTLVDLGGNIGLTTLWLAHQYPSITQAVVVEPFPPNAVLAERNLATSDLNAQVITAAIAPYSGTAQFVASDESNLGRLGQAQDGLTVRTITMSEVLEHVGGHIDILKMDIEGGEQELLTVGDLSWLDAVDCIIAEFHPSVVDYQRLTRAVVDHGFHYHRAGSLWANSMDIFVRGDGHYTQ
jgi:FkbM family methyltransferase